MIVRISQKNLIVGKDLIRSDFMKSRTKYLTFCAVLWFSCLFFLLYLASRCDAQEYTEPDDYYFNQPKLLDCQTIKIDESFIGGKAREQTVCFWKIQVGNQTMIMWKEIGKDKFGFIGNR